MNEKDDVKILRLEHEKQFINNDFVEALSKLILDELVRWSNENIFKPRGGELQISITLGSPNAGVYHSLAQPLHPRMEIRLALLADIYRDAFTFPIVSHRIANETTTLRDFHQQDIFRGQRFVFDQALPDVPISLVAPTLHLHCATMAEALKKSGEERIGQNEVNCRFLMFELMLVWTFFHELGHVVQRHNMLRYDAPSNEHRLDWFTEFEESEPSQPSKGLSSIEAGGTRRQKEPDIAAQARELLADAEGLEFTLKYLRRTNRIEYPSVYLLLCSIGCMFQRFYNGYQEDLGLTPGTHPHPAIRDDVAQGFTLNWVADYLVAGGMAKNKEQTALPLTYCCIRASLMTGLFRSARIEKRDDHNLPSYMKLFSEMHHEKKLEYLAALFPVVKEQARYIEQFHIVPNGCVASLLQAMERSSGLQ